MDDEVFFPVQLHLRDGSWLPLEEVGLVQTGTTFQLQGELKDLLRLAGQRGCICYLARNSQYALPLRFRYEYPDGKIVLCKFLWVFPDYDEPVLGVMKSHSWFNSQDMVTRMSVSDFVVVSLNSLLEYLEENEEEDDPADAQPTDEEVLDYLFEVYETFMDTLPDLRVHMTELYSDKQDGNLRVTGYKVGIELDGSVFAISPQGFLVAPETVYAVANEKGSETPYRFVRPPETSLEALAFVN